MPLLDHFLPPLSGRRHWESFHGTWANAMMDALNRILPDDYFAEAQVHNGPRVEIDISAFDGGIAKDCGTVTIAQIASELSAADLVVPTVFPPEFGVRVYETAGGPTLVAAIELVSPANKDCDDHRRAFTAKCAAYLYAAVGLMVVDVVTSRHSRPLVELMTAVHPAQILPVTKSLTAASYRPVRREGLDHTEVRVKSLAVGQQLPTLPLALGGLGHVLLDLEATYEDARERSRL